MLRRRAIVLFLVLCLVLTVFAGCAKETSDTVKDADATKTEAPEKTGEETQPTEDLQLEAPMLAELVEKGELPPLAERIPVEGDVMVEQDVIELGEYGGSWDVLTHDHAHWTWGPYTEQSLFRFKQDGSGEVEANICKDFYSNEDSTVWTVELREGMKWSDGEPLTADDVVFYYDHMSTPALNDDRSPVGAEEEGYYNAFTSKPYRCYFTTVDGTNYWAKLDKVDDYKYTVTFKSPKPNFPEAVAVDNKWGVVPKHFFINIVSRKDGVTDDESFPFITEEEALANANRLLEKEYDKYSNMGKKTGYYNWDHYQIPQVRSFIATKNNWNKVGEVYELVRNPYFFKTDSQGRQLPYLDSIKVHIVNEADQQILKATAGELDFFGIGQEHFSTVASATKDTHRISKWNDVSWGQYPLSLNQTIMDPDKRALFQSVDFRQALSIAVDRNLLNATLANNQAEAWQLSPAEGMLGYDAEWSKKWTEFDVDKSNKLLDGVTEPWDGADGTYRKMKGTNKDVELKIMLSDSQLEQYGDFIGLLKAAYKKIGVKVLDQVQADVAHTILANEHEVTFDSPYGATPVLRPDAMVPMRNYSGWYGAYGKWYEDNRSTENGGIEPTGDMLALVEAYDAMGAASGANRQKVVMENAQKIYDLHKENVWVICYLSPAPARYLISNELQNYPDGLVMADEFRYVNLARPEQFFKTSK
jgi:peptide/nickel transport system substrate-binding protein